jgi:hypothetical protein
MRRGGGGEGRREYREKEGEDGRQGEAIRRGGKLKAYGNREKVGEDW